MINPTTQEDGFFSAEQIDRMNLKTLANELPEGYDGQQLMALLSTKVCEKTRLMNTPFNEARQAVVDWYCATPANDVARAINIYGGCTEYQCRLEVMNFLHSASEEELQDFEEYLDNRRNED